MTDDRAKADMVPMESPNFKPKELDDFAERGFKRRNRHDRAKALDIRQAEERARRLIERDVVHSHGYQIVAEDYLALLKFTREAVKIAKYACECHNTPQGPDPENCDGCGLQARAREMGVVKEARTEPFDGRDGE